MSKARVPPSAVFLAAVGMEMCYLSLGLLLARQHLGLNYLAFTLILLIYLLSPLTELVAAGFPGTARRIAPLPGRLAIALVSLVAALSAWQVLTAGYTVGGVLVSLVFCGLAWWLGSTLVRVEASYYRVLLRFQLGILFLLIFAGAGALLPVVVFAILAGFALARARWETALSRSGAVLQAFPYWSVLLSGAAILVAAALVFLAVSPDAAGNILHWFGAAYDSFIKWFTNVMSSDFWQKPLIDINWRPSCIENTKEQPTPVPTPPAPTATVSPIVLWVIVFAICLAVLVFITLAIRKLRIQSRNATTRRVDFEAKSMRLNIFSGLATLMQRIWNWLRQLLSRLRRATAIRFPPTPEEAVTSMRLLYRDLLRWAAKQAVPRDHSQTAVEYLKILCQKFPQEARALAFITDVYLQARYSCRPITGEQFDSARKAWQKVKLAT